MYENLMGKFARTKAEIGDVRKLITWVELYYLKEGKRAVTWDNLVYNPNLKIWVYSSNSDVYFMLEGVTDNIGLRRYIARGDAYVVFDQEHDDNVKMGMAVIGRQYGFDGIKYESQYLPLVEWLIRLEEIENLPKSERSEAEIQAIKRDINQLKLR